MAQLFLDCGAGHARIGELADDGKACPLGEPVDGGALALIAVLIGADEVRM